MTIFASYFRSDPTTSCAPSITAFATKADARPKQRLKEMRPDSMASAHGCQANPLEFTAALRRSCVGVFEVVLIKIVNMRKTETKTMFRFAPSLGDNFDMQFI